MLWYSSLLQREVNIKYSTSRMLHSDESLNRESQIEQMDEMVRYFHLK